MEEERYRNVISWSDDGKHFTVHDVNRFTTDVMPEHFSHTNFSSFVRQLNSYVSPAPIRPDPRPERPRISLRLVVGIVTASRSPTPPRGLAHDRPPPPIPAFPMVFVVNQRARGATRLVFIWVSSQHVLLTSPPHLTSQGFRKVDQASWSFANPGFFKGGAENLKFIERKGLEGGRGGRGGRGNTQGYAGAGAYGRLGRMAGTRGLGLNVGGGAMDGHLLQDNPQDTFEAIVTQQLQLSRIEMANLMHRLTSVEKVQEQLLGILINQQTTMLNGASAPTAATPIPATTSTSTSLPASVFSGLTGAAAAMAVGSGVHGSIGSSGINIRGGILPAHLQHLQQHLQQQHMNQQHAQQLHLNQQQLQQLQSQQPQQLDLGGITIREAPLMQSQNASALAPKPEPAPPPPVKPNDPALQTLASISGLSNQLAGVSPILGLGLDSAGTGLDPGSGAGGGAGLAGGGGSLANGAGLNLGGLGAGLAAQPGLLHPRQYP